MKAYTENVDLNVLYKPFRWYVYQISALYVDFHFNYFQLLTAINSLWQLIWKKINWNFHVHTKVNLCAKFQLSRLIFIFINCYPLLSAVDNCWELMTADMKKMTGIFMHTLNFILMPNFSSLGFFLFLSTVISCHRLLTADMKKKLLESLCTH